MEHSDELLIQRLQERKADRDLATAAGRPPQAPVPPTTADVLAITQRALGFKIPELLAAIYLRVANGGFGPAYGIVGVQGNTKRGGATLETCYHYMLNLESQNPVWRWPRKLLPLADYGGGLWTCVDCADPFLPMMIWDPNNLDSDLRNEDARINWGSAFWDEGESLRQWLEGWVAETEEPEPTWPSDNWMTKRLGFTLLR